MVLAKNSAATDASAWAESADTIALAYQSLSTNTRKQYDPHYADFCAYCRARGLQPLAAPGSVIAEWVRGLARAAGDRGVGAGGVMQAYAAVKFAFRSLTPQARR